jgi:hypothetical protein
MDVTLIHRTVDWGLSTGRRLLANLLDSFRLARNRGRYDITIVSTAGAESFLTPLFWRLFNPQHRSLVLLDIIPLHWRVLDRLFSRGLCSVSLFLCIRRGDIRMLHDRYGVPENKCRFIRMPCPLLERSGADGPHHLLGELSGYVYSAGSAHRNWSLLLRAVQDLPFPCVIATQSPLGDAAYASERLTLLPAQTSDEGRALLSRAALVALAFDDTDLACGPTIVLDALALGIPVVATDTNACRDYIVHGQTGLLSDPTSPEALSAHVQMLMEDKERRLQMGSKARAYAVGELNRSLFEERVVDALHSIAAE